MIENIKRILAEQKINTVKLFEKMQGLGYTGAKSTFLGYFSRQRKLPLDLIPLIAEALKVSEQDLFTSSEKPVARVPVVGEASCGLPISDNMQVTDSYCLYRGDFWSKSLYCVIASGDSMAPEIEHGDEVVCDPHVKPQSGDMVHYRIGDESAIKIFVEDLDAHIIQFVPYNSNETFKTKTIRLDDFVAEAIKISKVVAVNKLKFNNRSARLKLIGRA